MLFQSHQEVISSIGSLLYRHSTLDARVGERAHNTPSHRACLCTLHVPPFLLGLHDPFHHRFIVEDKISFQLSRESARSQVLCTSAYVLSYWQRVYALSYNERDVDDYSQD